MPPVRDVCGQLFQRRSRRDVEGDGSELLHEHPRPSGVEAQVLVEARNLRSGVVGEHARQAAQPLDQRLDVHRDLFLREAKRPERLRSDVVDLVLHAQGAIGEEVAERVECGRLDAWKRFATRDLPQRLEPEREGRVVARDAGLVHAKFSEVEEDAVHERALLYVAPDLLLGVPKVEARALRVEHEGMCNQVDRREIRLLPTPLELRKVAVRGKAKYALEKARENGLREQLLVRAGRAAG
jgi:hypothetical protein